MKWTSVILVLFTLNCAGQSVPDPTWADNVACIVYSHCTNCHRSGGIAPFELMTYNDAFTNNYEMMVETQARFMPPWPPDEDYRELAHERVLTQDEIDIIAEWVNDGAPEGDPNNAPAPPVYTSAWDIVTPDLSVVMANYTVPVLTDDLYRCFVLPTNTTVDSYIHGLEVVPGNQDIVHHVLVFQDTSGQAQSLDAGDPGPGYTSFGGIGVSGAQLLGLWVPGSSAFYTPTGMSMRLLAGADIVIQVHYPLGSDGQLDSTRVNMQFGAPTFRTLRIDPLLDHIFAITNGPLIIPPDQVVTFHEQYTVPIDGTIIGIGPHAHLVCTSMWAYAVTPANDSIPLIDIPEWDLHWQDIYMFRNPIKIPAGSVLHGYATYDNTVNNINNPNNPPQWVFLGEATTDEMMLFYFPWTVYFPGDENIIIDTTTHAAHHLACDPTVTAIGEINIQEIGSIWPSPATDVLNVEFPNEARINVRLFDSSGKLVHKMMMNGTGQLDIRGLGSGYYSCEIRNTTGHLLLRSKVLLE